MLITQGENYPPRSGWTFIASNARYRRVSGDIVHFPGHWPDEFWRSPNAVRAPPDGSRVSARDYPLAELKYYSFEVSIFLPLVSLLVEVASTRRSPFPAELAKECNWILAGRALIPYPGDGITRMRPRDGFNQNLTPPALFLMQS